MEVHFLLKTYTQFAGMFKKMGPMMKGGDPGMHRNMQRNPGTSHPPTFPPRVQQHTSHPPTHPPNPRVQQLIRTAPFSSLPNP